MAGKPELAAVWLEGAWSAYWECEEEVILRALGRMGTNDCECYLGGQSGGMGSQRGRSEDWAEGGRFDVVPDINLLSPTLPFCLGNFFFFFFCFRIFRFSRIRAPGSSLGITVGTEKKAGLLPGLSLKNTGYRGLMETAFVCEDSA